MAHMIFAITRPERHVPFRVDQMKPGNVDIKRMCKIDNDCYLHIEITYLLSLVEGLNSILDPKAEVQPEPDRELRACPRLSKNTRDCKTGKKSSHHSPNLHSNQTTNMAYHSESRSKRVFLNNIDSYSSKFIAQFLSSCVVGESLTDGEEEDIHEHASEGACFQIVGTVANKDARKQRFALEEYWSVNREELLQCLMNCDVIVYNITEHTDLIDEATWAISALHSEIEHFKSSKIFILLSTIMTWAMTKPADPDDPDIPLTEEDYKRKRPHPNFKEHTSTEKLVLKLGKTKKSKLATYVVTSGLQYGMGESMFHFFFKTAWLGELSSVPVFGAGTNIIPAIHIHDLARVVQNIIDHKPKTHYFIAVDDSKNTFEDIVKAIASALGSGQIEKVPKEDAYGTKAITETDLLYLSVNLQIESVFLKDKLNISLDYESGIVENIFRVVEEYKQTRHLLPIKICLLGPPAVGKSSVATKLCRYYKLHHINVSEAISEKVRQLEELLGRNEKTRENEEMVIGAEEQLKTLKNNMLQNDGQLDEQHVMHIIREKLNSMPCRNQGFVLDGYPKTFTQAQELFYDAKMEVEDTRSTIPQYSKVLIPEFVFSLDATDEFLKERVQSLPQNVAEEMHYTQDEFTKSLAKFRETLAEDESVLDYFDELEIHPEHIDCENEATVDKIIKTVGRPMNYGLSPEEMEEERKRKEDECHQQLKQEKLEKELRKIVENDKMDALLEEWNRNMAEVIKQEHEQLETRSVPMRHYLMKYVMPTVIQGLVDCCKVKPDDPVDFLAEYLFRNNSDD
ncbi:adenylate kinase 7a [Chanodichthys erythropterus]|uniref:adenylate kinase 7a n=1 Tax=Chanodichthys erythropterus TaxID=933992 RepID=UPI00351F268B